MSLGKVSIAIEAAMAQFESDMGRAARMFEKETKRMEREAKRVEDEISKAWAGIGKKIGLGIIGAVTTGLTMFVRNTAAYQHEIAQLDAILESTGHAAGYTREQLVEMAREFQKKSTFGITEIVEAETRMLSYSGIVSKNVPRAMQAAMDQSTRLGMNLSQSAEMIGRALESPAKAAAALAQQGFGAEFTKEVRETIDALVATGREAEAQVMILDILEESYGGASEAARNTLGGALKALKNTVIELSTGEDGSLDGLIQLVNDLNDALNSPGIKSAVKWLSREVSQFFREASDGFRMVKGELEGLGQVLMAVAGQGEAAAKIIGAAFRLSAADIREGIAAYREASALGSQGLGAMFAPAGVWSGDVAISDGTAELAAKRQAEAAAKAAEEAAKAEEEARKKALAEYKARQEAEKAAREAAARARRDAEKAIRDAEREAERLQQLHERTMQQLHRQRTLIGEVTEADRIRYEIAHGELAKLLPEQQKEIEQAAELLDLRRQDYEAQQMKLRIDEERQRGVEDADRLVKDMEFELRLLSLSNVEREKEIALRTAGAHATEVQREQIERLVEELQQARELEYLNQMVQQDFADALFNVATGAKSAGAAIRDMLADMARQLAQFMAQKAVQRFFEAWAGGSTGGSSGGGGWGAVLASLFGGGRAVGGPVSGNRLYEVGEGNNPELFKQGGKTYLIPGNDGNVIPATKGAGLSGGGVTINTHVTVQGPGGSDDYALARQIGEMVSAKVDEKLIQHSRQGGMLWGMRA